MDGIEFEHELERQIFMAINMCRYNPAQYEPLVQQVKDTDPAFKFAQGTQNLKQKLKTMLKLKPVKYDKQASDACFKNNE